MRAKRLQRIALWGLLVSGVPVAQAGVKPGGKLYVKARNTKLMQSVAPTAPVVALLQPGAEVVWRGADAANKRWHKVEVDGKAGVVFQSNLSPDKPSMEVVSSGSGSGISPQVFASSGAATKALSEGSLRYAESKGIKDAPKQLLSLEHLSRQVTDAEIAARNEKVGLFVVVAPPEGTAATKKKGGAR